MLRTLSLALLLAPLAAGAEVRPFDVDDLVRLDRISDPQLSADGTRLVYALRQTDWDANKGVQSLWQLALDEKNAQPRRLTATGSSAMHPRFAGDKLYFLSTRSGSAQVWVMDGPGEARAVTELPLDVGGFLLSPDGKRIALALEVYPECGADFACSQKKAADDEAEKTSGTRHDKLFIRHWDTWQRGTRAQLFLFDLDAAGKATGSARWLTQGIDGDAPTKPFGDMGEVAFSPDGAKLVFTARIAGKTEPWSTNTDLYEVATTADGAPRNLTPAYPGYDTTPVYSPDGKRLYWRSMERAGYEADRNRILELTLASGVVREVAPGWDRSPDGLTLSDDGRTLYVPVDDLGEHPLYAVDVRTGAAKRLTGAGQVSGFALGDKAIYAAIDDLDSPADIHRVPLAGGKSTQLTQVNAARLKDVAFGAYEQFSFKGWNDETVYGWVVKPVGLEAGKKYPVAFLVHGGPQGSDSATASITAGTRRPMWAPGFTTVAVDFHGSTGYGQAFTDAINGHWGDRPLEDLEKGLAAALAQYSWMDGGRVVAAGASYGGYMINWMAGQPFADKFKAFVCHDGNLDERMAYFDTEELWFPEWEHGGTPWAAGGEYGKHNPVDFVKNWKVPTLVVHGGLDYRVVDTQGLSTFTALRRMGVPARLLYFPDENHWVLKPQNSIQWHRTVEAWMTRHTQAR
jgi:dipeptidyl aminopeptidase/acylaminoacyl peptidase